MVKNYTKTEKWYLLSNADQILSFKKFGFVKLDYFCNKNNNTNNNKHIMLLNTTKKIS